MAKITVSVQLGRYPSEQDRTIILPVDDNLIYEAYESIDLPSIDCDPLVRELICTSTVKIAEKKKTREEMASWISKPLLQALLDSMEQKDTEMGYKATK